MDDLDRTIRHLEEVTEEIQALKHRLGCLEAHRADLRKLIKAGMSLSANLSAPLSLPFEHRDLTRPNALRTGDAFSLRQTAEAVEQIGGDVDAKLLAQHLDITFDAARLRLARAARLGLVVRVSLGKYRAPKSLSDSAVTEREDTQIPIED